MLQHGRKRKTKSFENPVESVNDKLRIRNTSRSLLDGESEIQIRDKTTVIITIGENKTREMFVKIVGETNFSSVGERDNFERYG